MGEAMAKRPTIDDVAKAAFVSRSVVSRVLNEHPNVSPKSRARVQETIVRLRYVPNYAARSLALNRYEYISILAPRQDEHVFANAFWALTFMALSESCINRGYTSSLNVIPDDLDPYDRMKILESKDVDGYILISQKVADTTVDTIMERKSKKPIVLMGNDQNRSFLHSVDVDNVAGAFLGVRYLARLGHRRIALISAQENAPESADRIKGYVNALRRSDIPVNDSLMFAGEFSHQSGYQGMNKLLKESPTAVFCTSDAQAVGALLAASEAGLNVPDDISVVGFDDLPTAGYTIPPLTTVRQPIVELGTTVTNTLIDLIKNDDSVSKPPIRQLLDPILIVRKSSGPPRSALSKQ